MENNTFLNTLVQALTQEINANNWEGAIEASLTITTNLRAKARKAEKIKRESEKKVSKK
jgi:hypothetical protein